MMTDWHIITGEFPPASGGVSSYCRDVARGLADAGDTVHVWCPASIDPPVQIRGVQVHGLNGRGWAGDFRQIDVALSRTPMPRRLLVQWVPQAYGKRSLNVAFCRWVRSRGRAGDQLELMIHEPYLAFEVGSLRHAVAAAIHRLMVTLLLNSAERVWVAIPAWADLLRSWTLGRNIPFCWLPVPSTLPVESAPHCVARIRREFLKRPDAIIVGHLGTYSKEARRDLRQLLPAILASSHEIQVHLLGRGSAEFLQELAVLPGLDTSRIVASGPMTDTELSCHLQACDVMVQPYTDGASTRRTTLMAALAHGLPVVTTTGPLSESFWRDSDAVATVPVGDLPTMAQTLVDLAHQPERRQRLGAAAKAIYDERFSLAHTITALRARTCEQPV